MSEKIKFERGSGNIYRDLGYANPEEELAKARLASLIYDIIEERELTQVQAGKILGIDQPKVSALVNGRLKGFSMERLFSFLNKLDRKVIVHVAPLHSGEAPQEVVVEPA